MGQKISKGQFTVNQLSVPNKKESAEVNDGAVYKDRKVKKEGVAQGVLSAHSSVGEQKKSFGDESVTLSGELFGAARPSWEIRQNECDLLHVNGLGENRPEETCWEELFFFPDDANNTDLCAQQFEDSTNIINRIYLEYMSHKATLVQTPKGGFLLSSQDEKETDLSDVDEESLEWIIACCLHRNLNEPIEFLIKSNRCVPKDSIQFGEPFIYSVIDQGQLELLRFLLDGEHVDINQSDAEGETLLQRLIRGELEYNIKNKMFGVIQEFNPGLKIDGFQKESALEYEVF